MSDGVADKIAGVLNIDRVGSMATANNSAMDIDKDQTSATMTTASSCTNGRSSGGRQVTLCHEDATGSGCFLIDNLWASYRAALQVDAAIVCHEYVTRVHKVVVAAFSPVLRSFLSVTSSWQANPTSAIQIDADTGAIRLDYVAEQGRDVGYLVEFMYTGKVTVPRDRVQALLRMAEVLLVKTLIDTIMSHHHDDQGSATLSNNNNVSMVDPACITFVHVDHKRHFGDAAWTMVNEGHVVDSTIVCRELSIRTHKPILSAASPVFGSLILQSTTTTADQLTSPCTNDWTRCGIYQTARGIQLDYVAEQTDDVLRLIEFAYRGRTIVSDVRITGLLQLATKLEVSELVDAISSWQLKMTQTSLQPPSTPATKKNSNKAGSKEAKGNLQKGVVNGIGSGSKAERIGNGVDRPRPQHRCHLCPFTSPHKQRLIQHLASIHRLDDRGNSLPDVTSHCTLCDFSCTAAHQLTQHYIKSHCKDKPYRCSLCDYATVVESELERHVRNRHPDRQRHECATCGFLARTKTGLTLHVRMHQRPKPHQCSACDERFTSLDKLKTHCKRKHDVALDISMSSDNDNSVHSDVVTATGVVVDAAVLAQSPAASTAAVARTPEVCVAAAAASSAATAPSAVVEQLPPVAVHEMFGYPCPECGVECHTGDMLKLHIDMYHHLMDNGHPIRGDIVRVVNNEEITELRVL